MTRTTAQKIISAVSGLMLRFSLALCGLMAAGYFLKDSELLPAANIANAGIISVLGAPGFLLLISLKFLV